MFKACRYDREKVRLYIDNRLDVDLLQPINFTYLNRTYYLDFNHLRIMQIKGESTVGKSLFVSDFDKQKDIDTTFANSLVINFFKKDLLNLITEDCNYDFVIIDNADIILDDFTIEKIKRNLWNNGKTHWVIIGQNFYSCVLSLGCVGELIRERRNDKFYFRITYSTGI
ncbi:MAG: hypothetical protein RR313_00120 [Anaerovoracaceae bacterium]